MRTHVHIYVHVGGTHYVMFIISTNLIWREFKFGNVLTIHQTAKLKSLPNFPAIWYIEVLSKARIIIMLINVRGNSCNNQLISSK